MLYHFTCRDGYKRIGRYNCILRPVSMWPYVWLTTESEPDFEATGLGSVTLKCDRRQFRYIVTDLSACKPWLGSPERARVDSDFLRILEEYGCPEQWRICPEPVPAIWDRTWRGPNAVVS